MTDSPKLQRVLAAIVAVCMLAGVGIALTKGEDDDPEGRLAATAQDDDGGWKGSTGDTAASTPEGVPASPTGDGGDAPQPGATPAATPGSTAAPSVTAAAAAPPTTAAGPAPEPPPPATDLGAAVDPGPVIPPAAGTYRYDTTVNGEKKETSTVVEDVSRSANETKQVITIEAEQFKLRNDVTWQSDKVLVPKSAILLGQSSADCDWTPDIVQAVLPMKEGVNWKNDTSCSASFNNVPVTLKRKTDSTVKGLERLRIGGEIVDVWRIEGTEHTEFASAQGGGSSDSTGITWFSPKHGMIVKTQSRSTSKNAQGQTMTTDITSELKSLKPS